MSQSFTLATPHFEGPLEALLNLIEARKLAISDVSLAEVADAYLAYIESLPELPLGETAQFILVASTLLLIKSRTLMPHMELSSEEAHSIEDLERRLKRYAVYRKAAKALRAHWGTRPLHFPKRAPKAATVFVPAESSIEHIRAAALRMLQTLPKKEQLAEAVVAPVVALEEVIERMRTRISSALRTTWSSMVSGASKHEAIIHFLAMLELVRSGSISATQDALFSDIHLEAEGATDTPRYG